MTRPMEFLYPYAKAKFPNYLTCEAYTDSQNAIAKQLTRLKSNLTAEQYEKLTDMLEEYELINIIELEAMFQAAFSVALDLFRT